MIDKAEEQIADEREMICSICAQPCRVVRHEFVTGNLPGRPAWTINAPLYFRASPDGRSIVAAYCGPACSMEGFRATQSQQPTPEDREERN